MHIPLPPLVFALVTTSGSLVAYNMHVRARAMLKMTAHSGDATTLDWHPLWPNVIATGGATDRSVKIWDLESYLELDSKDDRYIPINTNTGTSVATESSSETDRSAPSLFQQPRTFNSSSNTLNSMSRHKSTGPKSLIHVLATLASVTRVRWRPPAFESFPMESEDRHGAMLAVATAPVKGASAGGAGLLALWSFYRPFMPLSVLMGHSEGAVTDFLWLDSPTDGTSDNRMFQISGAPEHASFRDGSSHGIDGTTLGDRSERDGYQDNPVGIWQHVLSVGRDGQCLIQSFVRGDRPISRVSPSLFAMANLSPFQRGYGSLQVFSVCQPVPSNTEEEYFLTGLRRDCVTNLAPGIFREVPHPDPKKQLDSPSFLKRPTRFPASSPELVFNIIDQGDLDPESKHPMEHDDGTEGGVGDGAITVAPEVVHLSRFAEQYVFYPDDVYQTRVEICLHNADVAEDLMCVDRAHMWRMVASMLDSSGMDELPRPSLSATRPTNPMQFVIQPTLKRLLEERADDGDVQTCVALCEVMQVIKPDQTVCVPDLPISIIREWYLSYIDLLRDMCLFSQAAFLIRSSNDPFVAALNQQSTTIHEACPRCGKPLSSTDNSFVDGNVDEGGTPRRVCRSCRRRVGMCFLCHEPVRGMYVWCPGCGHGGHVDHALQWFGGLSGKPVREMCPTGCGHKCNMFQQLISFPRTESLNQLQFSPLLDNILD